ncbi:hypothetical protein LuPra_01525 [Luteitalea pratensis]|uniref:Uncharacterized protein n=1 Tax=Luteitalea pratensis TaxID=1855912 RepID=A0A143PIK6_LUTPR|nr:hypothetical protein [Luteitalea pratensis]AMY08331.1 hypothetical protein LuPra_01525 [Luteitalea pratensis]
MRGALVASTYPLAPILEPPVGTARTTFAGQEAVGVFRATQYLLRRLENASDGVQGTSLVTDPRDPRVAESHQVWLSVIGSDAFWPLRVAPAPGNTGRRLRATASTWLILLACLLFVGVFIVSAIRALLAPRQSRSSGIATDAGRRDYGVLAAPSGTKWTGVAHAFAVAQAGAVVSVLTFGAVFILLSRVYGETSLATTVIALVAWGLMIILSLVVAFDAVHRVRHDAVPALKESAKGLVGRCKAGGDANDLRNVAALLLWALLYITTVWAAVALGAWMLNDVTASQPALQTITYKRLLAGGIVSPVSGLLCICCALLVPILWDRNRGTLLADGYQHYEQTSPCFRYLLGAATDEDTNLRSLAFSLDAPLRSLTLRRVSFVVVVAIALYVALRWHGFSLDGKAFSQFLWLATFGVLLRALVQLIQAIESWRHLSEALGRIKHEPFIAAAKAVHNKHLAWNVSLFSVRVGHMVPVIRLLQRLAATEWAAQMPDARAAMQIFSDEAARSPKMPAAVSQTWCASWKVVESVLPRVRATLWVPHGAAASAAVTGRPDARCQVTDVELFIALHLAFMLRDMVSRIVCTMGNALTSLGLLVLGHLLYTFQGRSTFLIVDMLFLIAAAATSLWLLVSVERDFVISMLRDTRPGRVEFNATFLRGVAVYVVLPVVAALGAVFPEIGIHFTSVLDPLRQIAGQ